MAYIDLRSDTVTKPTAEMREAMMRAEVGDDVYGEDPTANQLQELAAHILGKEAALFVPSGSMGNQICVRLHTQIGQEVIVEERSHMFNMEMGAMAAISGTLAHTVCGDDGVLDWPTIAAAVRPRVSYFSQTGLIAIENTLNLAGGTVIPLERMEEICERAHEIGLPVHLDGARIFNAAAALGRDVADLVRPADSVMFCLSKGLAAPVGSLIAGSRDFIDRAIPVRKMLGGGMRQVGVLAAAGLVALEKMTVRLVEDHANAKLLAEGLAAMPGVKIDPERVQTNILVFDIAGTGMSTSELSGKLKANGVLANGINPREMRMVTHNDVSRADCETSLDVLRHVFQEAT
ncbi:MAG TPA: GntG family PLP-dependent aldolase [Blastocatellia bacterium]|nr:GntG family PLP-dependent aldolase [Blastocatellia bacterium]